MSADHLEGPSPRLTPSVNVEEVLAGFEELWAPRVVARVNDYAVKVAKVRGEYVWHAHQDTDELFWVLSGQLHLHQRNAGGEHVVVLGPQDMHVVPRGVEHRPVSADGAVIVMVEPAATLSTGDYSGQVPDHVTSTRGLAVD
ncbi:Mannose-6-phosphate isomerase, cupin superfamily [Quadrisphaera granulorum]|uniref:Mannose-6-phosphate isomerase-like protein (Cupin superfamily) n=1 Tax=Quadrisphaera granulorum TaxID=317664 RepID=A0A316ACJ1_9ACTN|nr:cupin domain-containing protein [Quadrisphaera granulorum]PWJ54614.1 mannose-6-phosphate isomerase-like protein (cupin superfamily) [Quadrisphaera granulorum]SZE95976.1 Mannose-6-phosphate isomerase, cupin superfamily [Quadrisphaera granulorum]